MTADPKLLLDEMLSDQIAVQLRARGFDVIAVVEDAALVSTPDEDLLDHATAEQRCLVTANIGDFAALHAQWRAAGRAHAGLVYLTSRLFPLDRSFVGSLVRALALLLDSGGVAAATEAYLRRAPD